MDVFENKRFVIVTSGRSDDKYEKEFILYDVEKDVVVASKYMDVGLTMKGMLEKVGYFREEKEKYLKGEK